MERKQNISFCKRRKWLNVVELARVNLLNTDKHVKVFSDC